MPIYEYSCLNCGLKFDYLLRSSQDRAICPGCNHQNLKRLISLFAFASKDASGNITTTSSGSGCSSCASHNCSTCAQ